MLASWRNVIAASFSLSGQPSVFYLRVDAGELAISHGREQQRAENRFGGAGPILVPLDVAPGLHEEAIADHAAIAAELICELIERLAFQANARRASESPNVRAGK